MTEISHMYEGALDRPHVENGAHITFKRPIMFRDGDLIEIRYGDEKIDSMVVDENDRIVWHHRESGRTYGVTLEPVSDRRFRIRIAERIGRVTAH